MKYVSKNNKVLLLFSILLFFFYSMVFSQDYKEILRQSWLTAPAPSHQMLKMFEGTWRQLYAVEPAAESQSPQYGKGKTENRLLFDGRYVELNGELTYSEMAVISKVIIGFDVTIDKYILFSMNSSDTYPITGQGTYDKDKKEFSLTGEIKSLEASKVLKFRITYKFEADNKYIYTYYRVDGNQESKSIEVANIKLGN